MPPKALCGIAGTGNMPCHLAIRGPNRRSLDRAAYRVLDGRERPAWTASIKWPVH
jgi:hypothetical protein